MSDIYPWLTEGENFDEEVAFATALEQFLADAQHLGLDGTTRLLLGVAFNAGWESKADYDA